jgi:hypothetical protein
MNDPTLLAWIKPEGENLAARLLKQGDAAALADELYLSVLSRPPSDEEKAEVASFLAARGGRREKAVTSLIWSLLASSEFCVNH